ncbi:hypothetical protein F511_37322 [Dorcoceras hygrometricum]|uniref:Uncharacterized protein n=1 Tax=Dorcoceras hygrometricum TaxID=472368 RepID=A0A2Z7CX86_9LAMI|nr:hypothetical protein F511_37322 [Dorcoceras hygrometricum]
MDGKQPHEDHGFLRYYGLHLGSRYKYEYSYTSILQGLAAGDTPDAPHNHLGTRGLISSPKVPTWKSRRALSRLYVTQRFRKKISGIARGLFQDLVSPKDYARSARELVRRPRRPEKIPRRLRPDVTEECFLDTSFLI